MRTDDLCQLAAELAHEHGADAVDYARRAVATLECEGETERAQFWYTMSILLDDIVTHKVDPDRPVTIN